MEPTTGLPTLPHALMVPMDPRATSYQLFITTYEPSEYTDWRDESMSWKETCYIGDWSPLIKLHLKGPDALAFFQSLSGFNGKKYDVGQAKHVVFTNKKGKIIGDQVLIRLEEDAYQLTGGLGVLWAMYKFYQGGFNAVLTPNTNDRFLFQVQGPTSLPLLEVLVGAGLREIPFMRCRDFNLCGVPVNFLRQGMSGEVGFELSGPASKAVEIYNAILEAGKHFGIRRLGGLTKLVNHVEACYPTTVLDYCPGIFDESDPDLQGFLKFLGPVGNQIDPRNGGTSGNLDDFLDYTHSPVEMGWGKTLCFDHEFPGCEILQEEVANPRQTICSLEWNSEDVLDVSASYLRAGEPYHHMELPRRVGGEIMKVMKDGKMVGISSSRCYSYYFRKMISLCVIDTELNVPGAEVEVLWGLTGGPVKRIRATVAPAPYKKDRRRADLVKVG